MQKETLKIKALVEEGKPLIARNVLTAGKNQWATRYIDAAKHLYTVGFTAEQIAGILNTLEEADRHQVLMQLKVRSAKLETEVQEELKKKRS